MDKSSVLFADGHWPTRRALGSNKTRELLLLESLFQLSLPDTVETRKRSESNPSEFVMAKNDEKARSGVEADQTRRRATSLISSGCPYLLPPVLLVRSIVSAIKKREGGGRGHTHTHTHELDATQGATQTQTHSLTHSI